MCQDQGQAYDCHHLIEQMELQTFLHFIFPKSNIIQIDWFQWPFGIVNKKSLYTLKNKLSNNSCKRRHIRIYTISHACISLKENSSLSVNDKWVRQFLLGFFFLLSYDQYVCIAKCIQYICDRILYDVTTSNDEVGNGKSENLEQLSGICWFIAVHYCVHTSFLY